MNIYHIHYRLEEYRGLRDDPASSQEKPP